MGFLSFLPCCSSGQVEQSFHRDSDAEKTIDAATTTTTAPTPKQLPKYKPYSSSAALSMFKEYSDVDEPDLISLDGMQKLCEDTQIPMDGALPIILSWQLKSKEMGKLTRDEWVTGTDRLKISNVTALRACMRDLESLLFPGGTVAGAAMTRDGPDHYDRTSFKMYAGDPQDTFRQLYSFSFAFVKPEASRNIEMHTSVALWNVLLVPKFPVMKDIVEFIQEKGTYRATNKDLWGMMLEFCSTFDEDVKLKEYTPDGEWPTLFDEFVAWQQQGKML